MPRQLKSPNAIPGMGDIIYRYRSAQEMTPAQFSERVGITPSMLNHIENDRRCPALPVLIRIAYVLDVGIDSLVPKKYLKEISKNLDSGY